MLTYNPVTTIFSMSSSISNYFKEHHLRKHGVNLAYTITNSSVGSVISGKGKIVFFPISTHQMKNTALLHNKLDLFIPIGIF